MPSKVGERGQITIEKGIRADALIVAIADFTGAGSIATFDRNMRGHGLPVVEP